MMPFCAKYAYNVRFSRESLLLRTFVESPIIVILAFSMIISGQKFTIAFKEPIMISKGGIRKAQ